MDIQEWLFRECGIALDACFLEPAWDMDNEIVNETSYRGGAFPAVLGKPSGEYSSPQTILAILVLQAALLGLRKSLVQAAMRCQCRVLRLEVSRADHLLQAATSTQSVWFDYQDSLKSIESHRRICRGCWRPCRILTSRPDFPGAHSGRETRGRAAAENPPART